MSQAGRGPSGTIRKKAGRYYAVVRYYDATGHRRERWLAGQKTETAAKKSLRTALGKQDRQEWSPSAERMTVQRYLEDRWLPSLAASSLRETTVASYSGHVRAYLVPALGQKRLDQVTGADLAAMYGHLRQGGGKGGRALSATTVARIHATVSRSFGDAVDSGLLAMNPARSVPRVARPRQPRAGSSRLRYWTAEQLRPFLAAIQEDRWLPVFHLAAHTGMRRGEVAGLRWQDVDLVAGFLTVRQTRTSASNSGAAVKVITDEPKSGKGRRIDLDPGTVAVLRTWRKRQAEDRLAVGGAWPGHGLVFTLEDGTAPHPDTISSVWDRLVKAHGVERITLHGLRHTHATILLMAGVPVKVVQERLGHATSAITQDLYGHVVPGIQAQAASVFAQAVGDGS